jgi:D-beta-D-heptose 7-phosphate kinase/D-beta-D-heptose 1-phosphate adenosyltransferase
MRLDQAQAESLLGKMRGRQVAVLGDLMLDEYLFGEVSRISPEAPVPIVRVNRERAVLGGAANVAANLKSVGAEPVLVGTLQRDIAGNRMQALLQALEIRADWLVVDPTRPTIIKTRVIGQQQQMIRIDREETGACQPAAVEALCGRLAQALEPASALIISDYAKGVVGPEVMDRVRELCRVRGIPWIVDPKPDHAALYRGAPLMTPNTKELAALTGMPAKSDEELAAAGQVLMGTLGLQGLLVTRSEKGMALFAHDARHLAPWLIPTEAREVFDVSGAGDTVIAVFSAAISTGADWQDAAMLANAAAGVVVGKMGTATATPAEVLRHYQDQEAL